MDSYIMLLIIAAFLGSVSAGRYDPAAFKYHSSFRQKLFHRRAQLGGCGQTPADIVFVLDESSSIHRPDFRRQLKFVTDVVDIFNVSSAGTHIGVMTFASDTSVVKTLNQYKDDADRMKTVIQTIQQRGGNTGTDRALRLMTHTLFNKVYTREGIPHIGIVITDGESEYPDRTAREARFAKQQGITMFAIGVGNITEAMEKELHDIASSPEYVYEVTSYAALEKLKAELVKTACEVTTLHPDTTPTTEATTTTTTTEPTTTTTTTPEPTTTTLPQMIEGCDGSQPMDVIFGIPDEAGIRDTELALGFVKSVVANFKIGEKMVKVGLTPRLCGDLSGIRLEENDDREALMAAIDDRGLESTQLSLQLEYLIDRGFKTNDGARPLAMNTAILLVDNTASDFTAVELLAMEAKQDGIKLIIIGVGPYINDAELQSLAFSDDHYFSVDNYTLLDVDLAEALQDRLCKDFSPPEIQETTTLATTTPPPQMIEGCKGHTPLDVLFAAPDEANHDDTETALAFISALVDDFWISPTQVRAGLTPRMCLDLPGFTFRQVDSKESIVGALDERRLRYTLMDRQLEFMVQYGFTEEAGARHNAVRFGVLICDNKPDDLDITLTLADEVKDEGITLIVIGIGDLVDQGVLSQIASDGLSLWVQEYGDLYTIQADIQEQFCEGISIDLSG